MKYKIHIGEKGEVIGFGPNDDNYQPHLGTGETLVVSDSPPGPTLENQLAAIEEKYAPKIAALREGIMSAYLTDGAIMDYNVSGLRTEWAAVIAQRNAEMEALLI